MMFFPFLFKFMSLTIKMYTTNKKPSNTQEEIFKILDTFVVTNNLFEWKIKNYFINIEVKIILQMLQLHAQAIVVTIKVRDVKIF